jgi:hypothetical protein
MFRNVVAPIFRKNAISTAGELAFLPHPPPTPPKEGRKPFANCQKQAELIRYRGHLAFSFLLYSMRKTKFLSLVFVSKLTSIKSN